jgi:hypothetical protein
MGGPQSRSGRREENSCHIFFTLSLVGGEWLASRLGRFTPGKTAPGNYWIGGGWMGPRAGQDDVEKRKFLPLPGLELGPLGRPARSQSLPAPQN